MPRRIMPSRGQSLERVWVSGANVGNACGSNGLNMDGNDDQEIEDILLAIALTISYSVDGVRDLRSIEQRPTAGGMQPRFPMGK